jgi:hypothetical protein
MTKSNRTVWVDSQQNDVLVQRGPNEFYVPLSIINRETLDQLRDAATDALLGPVPAPAAPQTK